MSNIPRIRTGICERGSSSCVRASSRGKTDTTSHLGCIRADPLGEFVTPSAKAQPAGGLQERNTQNQPEGPPFRCSRLFGLLGPPFDGRPLFSLLVFLLPLPADVEFLLLAPEFRRAFPRELVPVERQRVLDGDLVTHELPYGGE